MDDLTRRARRYTTGRTVLDTLAIVFLGCSLAFWFVLHWQVLAEPTRSIPQIVVAVAMTLIYSLALPLLLSMLVPTTPAGQLLQKTQWRTIGFPVIIMAALFLVYHGYSLMHTWFLAQPAIADARNDRSYALAAFIGLVVIPALCWVQVTPERWMREIQTAHQVRKLEIQQAGELAIIKARLLWAEQKAAVSYAKLLPAEQAEIRDTLQGLLMGIADTQRSIVRSLNIQADFEQSIMGDAEIAESIDYVAEQLERPARSLERSITWIDDRGRESAVEEAERVKAAHVDSRLQSSESRAAESGRVRQSQAAPDDADHVLDTIRDVLPRIFTAQDVADQMRWKDKRPAQRIIRTWLDDGDVKEVRLGRYSLTE